MNLNARVGPLLAGSVYFALVFAAGFALGVVRVLIISPHFGEFAAVLLELPVILLVSWFACDWIVRTLRLSAEFKDRLLMGGTAFGLLLLAEAGVATLGLGRSFDEHVSHYATLPAQIGLTGQVAFALFPLFQR